MSSLILTSAVWLHNLDPYAIHFGADSGIRWYGLAYMAGFLVAYLLLMWAARRRITPLSTQQVGDFVVAAAIGTMVGGRLGYCFFYQPHLLWTSTGAFPYWGLLALNHGGMSSHGGIIGICVACLWYARKSAAPPLHLMDLAVQLGPIGVFFGRIANFINGELFGRAAPPGFPYAVKFPTEMIDWSPARIQQLDDAFFHAGINDHGRPVEFAIHAIQHGNAHVIKIVEPLLVARYPSQIFEAVMEGLVVFIVLAIIWTRPRKPGVIAASFLIVYAVVRIIGEHFRLPDSFIGYEALGMTRGQWLSLGQLLLGLLMLAWVMRRRAPKLGGWAVRRPAVESAESATKH